MNDPKTGKPISPHDAVCQAVGILQAVYMARDTALDAEALWGVFHMEGAAIEAAIALLVDIMPEVERIPSRRAA